MSQAETESVEKRQGVTSSLMNNVVNEINSAGIVPIQA